MSITVCLLLFYHPNSCSSIDVLLIDHASGSGGACRFPQQGSTGAEVISTATRDATKV